MGFAQRCHRNVTNRRCDGDEEVMKRGGLERMVHETFVPPLYRGVFKDASAYLIFAELFPMFSLLCGLRPISSRCSHVGRHWTFMPIPIHRLDAEHNLIDGQVFQGKLTYVPRPEFPLPIR